MSQSDLEVVRSVAERQESRMCEGCGQETRYRGLKTRVVSPPTVPNPFLLSGELHVSAVTVRLCPDCYSLPYRELVSRVERLFGTMMSLRPDR